MKNYIFNIATTGKKQAEITCEGNLTLQNAVEIKNQLAESLKNFNEINFTVKNIAGLDLSFYQLIESFKISLYASGKKLNITYVLPDDIKSLFKRGGFNIE